MLLKIIHVLIKNIYSLSVYFRSIIKLFCLISCHGGYNRQPEHNLKEKVLKITPKMYHFYHFKGILNKPALGGVASLPSFITGH